MKNDIILKNYWNDTEHFADLFNAVCFEGETAIDSRDLSEYPTELFHKGRSYYRDVVMKYHKRGVVLALLTIENQSKIHYAMPIRSMLYDALSYHKQWRDRKRTYAKENSLTGEEFLSGMKKEDRFIPVISIVFYHGEESWDFPKSLHDILEIPPGWEPLVKDYSLNLLDAGKCRLPFSDKDNQNYFQLLSLLYDEKVSLQERKQNVLSYCDNEEVTAEVLATVCASSSKYEMEYIDELEGVTHVCKVFEAEREEGRREGIVEGRKEGIVEGRKEGIMEGRAEGFAEGAAKQIVTIYQKMKQSNDYIRSQLMEELGVSTEVANEYLALYGV